jgi:GWxTD domain-containing protein
MMKVLVCIIITCTSISYAQFGEEMPRPSLHSSHPVIFEAIPFWSNDTTSIELAIFYRILPEFFFFSKTNKAQQEIYQAKGELVFELFDEKDAAVAREFRPLLIERNSLPEEGNPFTKEITGTLSFKLTKGRYKIVAEAKDSESGNSFINRDTKIDTRIFSSGLNISPSIFVEPISSNTSSNKQLNYIPTNRGGSVIIGQPGGCLLQITSHDTSVEMHVSWKVTGKGEMDEDTPQELHGDQTYQEYGTPVIQENPKRVSISIASDSKRSRMVFIPVPFERLESGKYQMNIMVTQGALKADKEFFFNVLWPLKPQSLFDLKLAIDALRHIATEAELDSINAFSSSKSMKAFMAFWRKRNPDTTRAYNPAMAEYYRRVDETIKRFSSANEMDGYRTDRGRIYILFGSPSFTNRLLKPNSVPTEIWTYENLKRRFTFTDQRKTGNYILTKMENY